ncbi:sn-glycerol-3-phosphate transport system permease protein ugpA [uncultured Roseburia sp.]|uniref:Sugar ABC transporter permease n=1 Tax=Brotonthovivens ammoniilytica TaxID=2981725 RepID=A0ABT2THW5_9FIRM|nr:sugar ABC transporter permease [Brotonthovivens ammoniilytica]MCU6761775.1 sugar ABC transporter permease [Brotonthovivens ammoniilytica]SCI46199.1 sn-glycerol-3-phosphate transport system permease protein ugpA [uncultured Roseburia sp.]
MLQANGSVTAVKSKKPLNFKKGVKPYLYLAPTLVVLIILLIVPIVMVISYAFFDNVIVVQEPQFAGLKNFGIVLKDPTFIMGIKNTLFFVIVSVIAHMLIGMFFAMLMNTTYLHVKTKAVFRVIYALPWMFTASVIAITWRLLYDPVGVLNFLSQTLHLSQSTIDFLGTREIALKAVTVINIWSGYPFYMISILAGLQGISTDLYEASSIDGANPVQQFFRITIPQLKPILISLVMLDFVWTIQQFALIWMTTGGGPVKATTTVSVYIYETAFRTYKYSQASAAAVLALIVCIIIAIFYVRNQRSED